MDKKVFILDIDETICKAPKKEDGSFDYSNAIPFQKTIDKINELAIEGHRIDLFTARGMRTFNGNVEKINEYHRPILEQWLKEHNVTYHSLEFGKPWARDYFIVDDRNITINQFLETKSEDYPSIIKHNTSFNYEK